MAVRPPDGTIVGTAEALAEEYAALAGAAGEERTALCLSGGGIRSAAFCLGVLQGLAGHGMLAQFHYLSTVSGGGFIGGWLSMLVARLGARTVEERLRDSCAATGGTAPPELRALRDYTNYLTPGAGLFALDSWTAAVLVGRNMMLNWLVFLPWFLAVVALVTWYREALWLAGQSTACGRALGAAALLCLVVGTVSVCLGLPSHRPRQGQGTAYRSPRAIGRWIVAPALMWSGLLPMALSRHWTPGDPTNGPEWSLPLVYGLATLLAYAAAGAWDWRRVGRAVPSTFVTNLGSWLIASAAAAGLLWLGLHLGATIVPVRHQPELLAVLGPLWLVLVNVLHAAVHVALRPEADRAELDREWLARISALKLRLALLWAIFAACCLLLPPFLNRSTLMAAYGALAAGPVGAWLGKQVLGRAQGVAPETGLLGRAFTVVPPMLCGVFAAVLFAALGQGVDGVLDRVAPLEGLADGFAFAAPAGWFGTPGTPGLSGRVARVALLAAGCIALAACAHWLGARINVNRFSLHGVYRNRVTRAFLGSARVDGRPGAEPLTGFDEADIVTMASLVKGKTRPLRLFPVVNTTLNLTVHARLAWSERKAAPFTITPLRSGSAALPEEGRFVRSVVYGGLEHPGTDGTRGIRLPGALTISGAAVSPNWGYHSSPLTAFVMTLFNVRLGAWMPNPANAAVASDADLLAAAMPPNSAGALFRELFGRTDATSGAVYLSDGGHFDNLGLYEMVRRECRLILVVDAEQDREAALRGLGEAVRKCGVDLGAVITLDRSGVMSRADEGKSGAAAPTGYAVGRVQYCSGVEGVLVYLKASWLRGLPVEVAAYGAQHADFPHETTLDQGFTESQFESYRALGFEQAGRLLRGLPKGGACLRERFGRMLVG